MINLDKDMMQMVASRSSGPGGQHVNKVNSRVTLWYDLAQCTRFSPTQKKRIGLKLGGRMDKLGRIRVASQRFRTQAANRQACEDRLGELIEQALKRAPRRIPTKQTKASIQRRLAQKKRRGQIKQRRSSRISTDD